MKAALVFVGIAAAVCAFGQVPRPKTFVTLRKPLTPTETTGTWVLTKGSCLNNFGPVPFEQGTQPASPDMRPTWHMTTMENGGTYGWSCWYITTPAALPDDDPPPIAGNATTARRMAELRAGRKRRAFDAQVPPIAGNATTARRMLQPKVSPAFLEDMAFLGSEPGSDSLGAGSVLGVDEGSGRLVTSMCEAFLGQLDFDDGEMVNVKRNELGTSTSYFQLDADGRLSGNRFKMTLAQPGHATDPRLFSPVVTKATYEKVSDDPGPMPEWDTPTAAASVTKQVVFAA